MFVHLLYPYCTYNVSSWLPYQLLREEWRFSKGAYFCFRSRPLILCNQTMIILLERHPMLKQCMVNSCLLIAAVTPSECHLSPPKSASRFLVATPFPLDPLISNQESPPPQSFQLRFDLILLERYAIRLFGFRPEVWH